MGRPKNIVASAEVPLEETARGKKFQALRRRLGMAAGGEKLGCSLYELPPGKAAFPLHAHMSNEEAVYIVHGEGVLRLGGGEHPIRAGDYMAFRAGGEPHQIVNRSGAPLQFLAFSTLTYPEVATYPESQKVGIYGGPAKADRRDLGVFKLSSAVDYWEGEE
jgi:uncharacterized cupin superfamily protein